MHCFFPFIFSFLYFASRAFAHFAAWHIGMYCLDGPQAEVEEPSHSFPANPLFQLPFDEWWFHHVDKCDEFPPAKGDFLELPANGQFTVELATNRAFTTLSFDGKLTGDFGNGQDELEMGEPLKDGSLPCIIEPNIHAQNETMAAGTAFAISYQSELSKVTPDNLVVFTILYNTPWKRIAIYDIPNLPACPEDGCICAWGWVANGCGTPNIYHQGFKCKVTGNTGSTKLAPPKAAVWCEDNPTICVEGAKQMIYWNQAEGNNIETKDGDVDLSGQPRSPGYNAKCGFENGAQHDIFLMDASPNGTVETTSIQPTTTMQTTAQPFATDYTQKNNTDNKNDNNNNNNNGSTRMGYGVWLMLLLLLSSSVVSTTY